MAGDDGSSRKGEAPGEDARPPKEGLLLLLEEIDAPCDGGAERLLTALAGPSRTAEDREPVVEPFEDGRR